MTGLAARRCEPQDEVETGIELTITSRVGADGKHFVLDLKMKQSEITGYERRQYKDKHSYDVPQVEELEIKCSDVRVPEGKTLLVFARRSKESSNKNPRNVMLLIKPQIPEPDCKPPTLLPGGMGGSMGGGFGGGFGSADE